MDHIRGLLFDKDGTLFDFKSTWNVWAERFFLELAEGDRAAAASLAEPLGFDFRTSAFRKDSVIIAGTPDEVTAALIAAAPGWDEAELVAHINTVSMSVPQAEPVPLVPLLSGLRHRGYRLGVATNDAEEPARAHLESVGITGFFDFVAGFDSGYGAKPEPGMQLGFCNAVGLAPEQVLMVGDSTHDLVSGRAAGMPTIAVLTGMADASELAPYADHILKDIGEIPALLG